MYDTHADAIFRFCFMKVSSREIAEDITQETFTRLWQQVRSREALQNERAFLYRVARNLIIDWYRKRKSGSLEVLTDAGFEFVDDSEPDPQHLSEFKEVIKTIGTLDEPTREALLLRFVEGQSPKDIARITGESANVISVRITRGLEKVRKQLHIS